MDQIPSPPTSADASEFSGLEPLRIVLQGACLRLRLASKITERAVAESSQLDDHCLNMIDDIGTQAINLLQAVMDQQLRFS